MDVTNFLADLAEQIEHRGDRVSLIEVGCGTSEFPLPLCDRFRYTVGLEVKLRFAVGDACELNAVIKHT
jgi:hypothetical protein